MDKYDISTTLAAAVNGLDIGVDVCTQLIPTVSRRLPTGFAQVKCISLGIEFVLKFGNLLTNHKV